MNARDLTLSGAALLTPRTVDLSLISFAELESAIDEATHHDDCDWDAVDELKAERDGRLIAARVALTQAFVSAMENASKPRATVPWVRNRRLVDEPVMMLADEFVSCDSAKEPTLRILAAEDPKAERSKWFAEMAAVYASDNADEILRAGWTS